MLALRLFLAASAAMLSGRPATRPIERGATRPIVRRHDRPDSLYRNMARRFDAVGTIGWVGNAILIGDRWAITAAHVVREMTRDNRRPSVRFGGKDYDVVAMYVHPRWDGGCADDIAVLELSASVSSARPIPLYHDTDELHQVVYLVGAGTTGTGDGALREDHQMRAATSSVDSLTTASLYLGFHAPPGATDLEGTAGPGDSGGPAIIVRDDRAFLAGVGSGAYAGTHGPESYGAVAVYTRVSRFVAWTDAVMRDEVEPVWNRAQAQRPFFRDNSLASPR